MQAEKKYPKFAFSAIQKVQLGIKYTLNIYFSVAEIEVYMHCLIDNSSHTLPYSDFSFEELPLTYDVVSN